MAALDTPRATCEHLDMCRVVTCRTCERATWAGCGAHIEKALAHVPLAERCDCPREPGGLGKAIRSLFGGKRGT